MIWFDLDNSPHVPLFRPILRELDRRSVPYMVTARDFAQTKELEDIYCRLLRNDF
jgi:predicted glycosyltransferase